jgi:DNA-binding MarR family transcriptional regulator
MHATDVKAIAEALQKETSPAEKDTAARIAALMHHMFLYDRGNQLRVIEETGLSITQCKVLLELGGLGHSAAAWQVSDLAEIFGVSVPSMSRAVDALVKAKLATRVEDSDDRRVRRVKITAKGKNLVATLVTVRRTGLESFVATLSAAQRRKLDAAVEALMDREDIAQTYEHLKGSDRS